MTEESSCENKCSCQNKCPMWAEEQIEYLRKVEVFRGTVPDAPNWQDETLKSIASRVTSEEAQVFDDDKLDFLFKKIVTKLHESGFTAAEIAGFINERVKLPYGPPYCNEEEIREALG